MHILKGCGNVVKVIAGIVLYNAEIDRLLMEINSILPQVDRICLCDNGSSNITLIEKRICRSDKIILLKNEENLGIGTASNQICVYAEKNGFEWVLMLDHDTVCPSNLIDTYKQFTENALIGMMCPNVVDKELVHNIYKSTGNEKTEYIKRCIQSATFVRISAWKKCGGFNEWMFIDFVDFDFCKRMELNGFKILRCNDVTVDHQLGKRVKSKNSDFYMKLYKKTGITIFKYFTYKNKFSKERVYYCTRNNIAYIKFFGTYLDKKRERKEFWIRIFKRILRSKNRFMIIKETIRGIYDGIRTDIEPYRN